MSSPFGSRDSELGRKLCCFPGHFIWAHLIVWEIVGWRVDFVNCRHLSRRGKFSWRLVNPGLHKCKWNRQMLGWAAAHWKVIPNISRYFRHDRFSTYGTLLKALEWSSWRYDLTDVFFWCIWSFPQDFLYSYWTISKMISWNLASSALQNSKERLFLRTQWQILARWFFEWKIPLGSISVLNHVP